MFDERADEERAEETLADAVFTPDSVEASELSMAVLTVVAVVVSPLEEASRSIVVLTTLVGVRRACGSPAAVPFVSS